jgi:hypothetical protein
MPQILIAKTVASLCAVRFSELATNRHPKATGPALVARREEFNWPLKDLEISYFPDVEKPPVWNVSMTTFAIHLVADECVFAVENPDMSWNNHPDESVIKELNAPALIDGFTDLPVPTHPRLPLGRILK